MSAIPDDISKAARRVCGEWNLIDAIASAILAERQRCADTARRYLGEIAGCDMNDDEPDKIATAVMDPKWEQPQL